MFWGIGWESHIKAGCDRIGVLDGGHLTGLFVGGMFDAADCEAAFGWRELGNLASFHRFRIGTFIGLTICTGFTRIVGSVAGALF
jgi:hypothetical protein